MDRKILIAILGIFFLAGCSKMAGDRAAWVRMPELPEGAQYLGNSVCLECHEDYATERTNIHLKIAEFEVPSGVKTGCESCHGPGSLHVDGEGDVEKILRFGDDGLEPEEVGGICTNCHQAGAQLNWAGSAHAENDVACTACHKVHTNGRKYLLKEGELDLCSRCHQDVRARTYYASHHPLKEEKMHCSDCHNPHGSDSPAAGMLKTAERVNDLCLRCHTRYQGPFAFEHDPVVEDCLICHDPHGTVANNLLRQQEPFICLQCHEAHFHAARASNNVATVVAPGDSANVIGPTDHGFTKSFMTKCTQCHPKVHGSDLPSQSVPGAGMGLTR